VRENFEGKIFLRLKLFYYFQNTFDMNECYVMEEKTLEGRLKILQAQKNACGQRLVKSCHKC
jgi:hypothetical protein